MTTTHDRVEEVAVAKVAEEDGDDEGSDEEEAAEEEDVGHGMRHGVDATGGTGQQPAVFDTVLLRDAARVHNDPMLRQTH